MNAFFSFLQEVGFDKTQLRIEKYRLDGTSNYLVSLNYSGTTWAIAIRIPAIGKDEAAFEKDKTIAVDTAKFLVDHFAKGVNLSDRITFCFRGNSELIPNEAIHEFFSLQNMTKPLIQLDKISKIQEEKIITSQLFPNGIDDVKNIEKEKIKEYFLKYNGRFFVSKGAPASETLDDYFELVFDVAHALAVLHSHTGLKCHLPVEKIIELGSLLDDKLDELSEKTTFKEGSPIYESFLKHQKKRNPDANVEISRLIRKELILRTDLGKELLSTIISNYEQELENKSLFCCFTHNDPHCENFVIVKYFYSIVKETHQYIDREFVNEILTSSKIGHLEKKYSIEFCKDSNELIYRNFKNSDEKNQFVNVITPDLKYEIHLIDIDEATGIDEKSKKLYIYDLLLYAQSVQNLSMIKGKDIHRNDIIKEYDNFRRNQK